MEISYCPYRLQASQILYSQVSPPVPIATFTGTPKDAELLEKVRRQNLGEELEEKAREWIMNAYD